jgi:hypothetical protein
MMLFHDLANQGWKTRIYHTAQIMAAAWRGSVHPVDHQPDPTIVWPIPNHLRQFL